MRRTATRPSAARRCFEAAQDRIDARYRRPAPPSGSTRSRAPSMVRPAFSGVFEAALAECRIRTRSVVSISWNGSNGMEYRGMDWNRNGWNTHTHTHAEYTHTLAVTHATAIADTHGCYTLLKLAIFHTHTHIHIHIAAVCWLQTYTHTHTHTHTHTQGWLSHQLHTHNASYLLTPN